MENFDYDLQSVQEARNLARLGKIAADKIADYTDEQIDKILQNMVRVAEENAVMLAKMAVEETGFGKVEDKTFKNHMASTIVYNYIKDMKCAGIISEDPVNKVMEVADPVGLIMGIVPSTNPTSTAIYKSMIAIKARNAIVFSPHPSALQCTLKAATLMRDAAVAAGAPENVIGCLSMPSMGATDELMKCKETSLIIATGGPGMVKAAYSAGKPALGVGAGNSPSYIERTADVAQSVKDILASKTFDNGTVCASEQSVICEECNRDQVIAEFKKQGGYFMTAFDGEQLIARPKETYDGAMPSGNSVAAMVLQTLASLTGEQEWQAAADRQLSFLAGEIGEYPSASCFGVLAMMEALYPHRELVCATSDDLPDELKDYLRSHPADDLHILLKTKEYAEALAECAPFTNDYPIPEQGTMYYLCENGVCKAPVSEFRMLKI